MVTLNHILNMGSESLQNARTGVDVTGHNIANAQTPGYSRQLVSLTSKIPIRYGEHILGDGATVDTIMRVHDRFLENQLRKEVQTSNEMEKVVWGLGRLEGLFNPDLTATVRDKFTAFGNSMRELSTFPEEPAARVNMSECGAQLCQSLNATQSNVIQIQSDATTEVMTYVGDLNLKLAEVAHLNSLIREMGAGNRAMVNDLEDKRDALVKEVGSLIDVSAYKDNHDHITVRGPGGCLLVEGSHSATLGFENTRAGTTIPSLIAYSFENKSPHDITDDCTTGKIGGLLQIRDKYAQNIRNQINTMATVFAESFNEIYAKGYGIDGYRETNGRSFFSGLDEPGDAALNIGVDLLALREPASISAAMTPEAAGDNVIVNNLTKLFYEPIFTNGTITVSEFYDKFIGKLGLDTVKARENETASNIILGQLKSQRESVAGVSIDEEGANLIKYQHLFTASSRVITTVDEMFKTVLDLKR